MADEIRELTDEAIAAIVDPLQRARTLRAIARDRGTLTTPQSRMYGEAIAEIRGDDSDPERLHKWIARRIGTTRSAVGRILAQHRARAASQPPAAEGAAA